MVVVLAAGMMFGPAVGLPAFDPLAGLVALSLGIIALILVVLFLGMRFVARPAGSAASPKGSAHGWLRRSSVLALGVGVAGLVGVANSGYAQYDAITGDLGNARLVRFDIRTAQIAGWSSSFVASLDQAKQFFGDQASWARVMYAPTRSASLQSSHPLYVDVIDTDDAGSLAAYTIADCYQFHHYRIDAELSADIGAGVQAEVVTYFDPKDRSDWSAVWWEWPKEFDGGVRYERIVMFIPNSNAVAFQGFDPAAPTSGVAPFQNAERFLVTAARDIVRAQLATTTADADGGTR
jgi:hypothetical protein